MSPALSLEGILAAMACLCSSTDNGGNNFYSSLGNQINMRYPNESIVILSQNDVTEIKGRLAKIEWMQWNEAMKADKLNQVDAALNKINLKEELNENKVHNSTNQFESTLTTTNSTQEIKERLNQLEATVTKMNSNEEIRDRLSQIEATLTKMHNSFLQLEANLMGQKTAQVTVTTPEPIVVSSDNVKNTITAYDYYTINECPDNVNKLCEEVRGKKWIVVYHSTGLDHSKFKQPFSIYQKGFGTPDGDFFIGLDKLHLLTNTEPHELLVEAKLQQIGHVLYGHYDNFLIDSASKNYTLKSTGKYFGNEFLDYFEHSKGNKFSTFDRVYNDVKDKNCADSDVAWWHGTECNTSSRYKFWISPNNIKFMIRPKDVKSF